LAARASWRDVAMAPLRLAPPTPVWLGPILSWRAKGALAGRFAAFAMR
jgi:hypothetical protein